MSTLSQFSGGGIKSIQRGTISVASSATATITAVNTAKTILNFCGCASGRLQYIQSTGGSAIHSVSAQIALTSSTQITATCTNNINLTVATVSYEVIEYF